MSSVICYSSGHTTSFTVCFAFAEGCNGRITGPKYRPGHRGFLYGTLRGLDDIWRALHKSKDEFWFCDNGYLGASDHSIPSFDGYYRIAYRSRFALPIDMPRFDRLDRLGIKIKPWRRPRPGSYILLCPPPRDHKKIWGFNSVNWEAKVVARINKVTNRKIRIAYKPGSDDRAPENPPSLEELLADAKIVVTWDSNIANDALLAGVPICVLGPHPANSMGIQDLRQIEEPILMEDRDEFFGLLAANQWTLDEFRDGTCWAHLQPQK